MTLLIFGKCFIQIPCNPRRWILISDSSLGCWFPLLWHNPPNFLKRWTWFDFYKKWEPPTIRKDNTLFGKGFVAPTDQFQKDHSSTTHYCHQQNLFRGWVISSLQIASGPFQYETTFASHIPLSGNPGLEFCHLLPKSAQSGYGLGLLGFKVMFRRSCTGSHPLRRCNFDNFMSLKCFEVHGPRIKTCAGGFL